MEQGASTVAQSLVPSVAQSMIAAWGLAAAALVALAIVAYVAIRGRRAGLEKAAETFRSLDIEAFRNLVDPAEEAFLRNHLPPRKFREIKRQRAWAGVPVRLGSGKDRDRAGTARSSRATELRPGDRSIRRAACRECFSASLANRRGRLPPADRNPIARPGKPAASAAGGSV